jgi:hypothetical protein
MQERWLQRLKGLVAQKEGGKQAAWDCAPKCRLVHVCVGVVWVGGGSKPSAAVSTHQPCKKALHAASLLIVYYDAVILRAWHERATDASLPPCLTCIPCATSYTTRNLSSRGCCCTAPPALCLLPGSCTPDSEVPCEVTGTAPAHVGSAVCNAVEHP